MDGPRDDRTMWSKTERKSQIPYDITYMGNLKYDIAASLAVQWLRLRSHCKGVGALILGWKIKIPHNHSAQPKINNQFSRSVVSDSLPPHGLHHDRLPCPSPTPRACSNSCPSSRWSHPNISSSVVPFSSCLQSCPASGSFPVSHFFTSSGQSIGFSTSASVLAINIQDCFPLEWTGWISLQSKGFSKESSTQCSKVSILQRSAFFMVQLSHPNMTTGKTIALSRQTFVGKVMSQLFNMLSRLVTAFLPRSKHLLISCSHHLQWFWSPQK